MWQPCDIVVKNLLDSPRSTKGPCCASPALGGPCSQEDNLSYQVDDDDDCHDGDYLLMWKYENENYHKLSGKGKEKKMLVMILSGPWIEDEAGDDHNCGDDDHDDGGT